MRPVFLLPGALHKRIAAQLQPLTRPAPALAAICAAKKGAATQVIARMWLKS